MKRLLHILLFVLPLLACTWEQGLPNLEEKDDAPEGRVTVTFSLSVPVEEASTKALSEDPQLNSLCLAVYGSSGGYKDYVVAEKQGETTLEVDFGGTVGKKTVACYTYKASLQLSNTARTIHFLGNGPAPTNFGTGKASTVLPDLLSAEGKTGFWQMIKLPGIYAAQNENGEYLDPTGTHARQAGEGYLISDETQHYFEGSYTCGGHIGNEECHYTYNPAFGDPDREIDAWTPFNELPDDWVCPVCGGPKTGFSRVGGIALIRNWSKIVLKCKHIDHSNFHPISFAVINVPVKGTLVPYGGKTGFIDGYESLGFTALNDENGNYAYPGNLPKGIRLTGTNPEVIPSKDYFENPTTEEAIAHGVRAYDETYDSFSESEKYNQNANPDLEPAVYLYERPIPSEELQPSYVLVYGEYINPEDETKTPVKCYYKVDLMAGGKYFPVYRNFKYQIIIETIASRGHATPENAAASAGSADVSADVNAAHLSDISDGTRRMAVQPWMSKTFINGVPFDKDNPTAYNPQLYVVFYDNINLPATDPNYGPNIDKDGKKHVWLELRPKTTGVILNPVLGEPGELGFRPIYFGVAAPGEFSKTQTLRIYCQSDLDNPEETPLYRDVVVTIQPLQPMKVVCKNERVNRYVGEEQEVEISIPDGLAESMFPLSFEIEPKDMTLTPDNQRGNMPVVWGPSMVDEKPSFHFIRTLTWEEYQTLERRVNFEDESRWRPFSCFFKTNCEYSGTTVYVKNKYFRGENRKVDGEYEEYAYDSFSSYRTFRSPKFTTSIPRVDGGTVGVSFGVQKENGAYQKVWVDVKNLTPVGLELENGRYTFTPTQDDVTLSFTTRAAADGDVAVTLSTEDGSYEAITLAPWRFTNVGILNGRSEVAFGGVSSLAEKAFKLGYITDPDNPAPQITVKDLSGVNGNDPIVFNHPNPVSGTARENYREKEFKTLAGTDPVSFTFSSTGYVEENVTASRFGGSIYSWDINKAGDWTTLSGGQTLQKTVTQNQVGGTFSLFIYTENDGVLQTNDNGIVLQKGGRYVIDASIDSDNKDVYLYYAQIFYQVSDGTALKPSDKDVEPNPDGSSYSAYLGNNEEYVWSLPWGQSGGSLKMNAPANRNIVIKRIILKGFHGVLYDSSNHGGGDVDLGGGLEEGGDL